MHVLTMPAAARSYQNVQNLEATKMLHDLLRSPEDYELWFERYSAGIIMRLGFGRAIDTGLEPQVRQILNIVHTIERVASPGAYLVDTFPILMHLPSWLVPFKREGNQLHASEAALFRLLQDEVRQKIRSNEDMPQSFTKTFLEKQEDFGLSDDEGAYVIGTLFEAGSGTTAAAMMSFCLAMCHYPEWQTKLQAEIDRVVGPRRMPTLDDMPNLPTVRAVVKEVLRWRPVTSGGVPHQLVKDDTYQGFFLPEGTLVHANQWQVSHMLSICLLLTSGRAIHRDPELYPDPEEFNPGRWLDPAFPTFREPLTKFPNVQNFSAFGFGRRICPGMNIAERSLYLLTARVAWSCEIRKKGGVNPPLYDYTPGFNSQPKPFKFDLHARDSERERLIAKTWEEDKISDQVRIIGIPDAI